MSRWPLTCTATPDCDNVEPCPVHPRKPRRYDDVTDARRPNSYARGYGGKAWHRARTITLRRDPVCTWPPARGGCTEPSTRADHYPRTRRQLLAAGVENPDSPDLMRGLCERHHNQHTAETRR